jgi:hypothetical protein
VLALHEIVLVDESLLCTRVLPLQPDEGKGRGCTRIEDMLLEGLSCMQMEGPAAVTGIATDRRAVTASAAERLAGTGVEGSYIIKLPTTRLCVFKPSESSQSLTLHRLILVSVYTV